MTASAESSSSRHTERAVRELARLRRLAGTVRPVEDLPDDPETVQLGDRVVIELAAGIWATYTIVHALEAVASDEHISADSALGSSLNWLARR